MPSKKPPEIEVIASTAVSILSVSPIEEDHVSLERILSDPARAQYTQPRVLLRPLLTVQAAIRVLSGNPIPIVFSEHAFWREILEHISGLRDPPLLIVTSRLADDYLWAEALNLGAYDVLAKPFHAAEVTRTVSLALQHWQDRDVLCTGRTGQRRAASAGGP